MTAITYTATARKTLGPDFAYLTEREVTAIAAQPIGKTLVEMVNSELWRIDSLTIEADAALAAAQRSLDEARKELAAGYRVSSGRWDFQRVESAVTRRQTAVDQVVQLHFIIRAALPAAPMRCIGSGSEVIEPEFDPTTRQYATCTACGQRLLIVPAADTDSGWRFGAHVVRD